MGTFDLSHALNERTMSAGFTAVEKVKAQGRLLLALMLRDIKTRFGGSEWGFLIAIGWPLSHILILIVIYRAVNRTIPYGDSAALWFATGVVPFMAFSYMSRFITYGIVLNKPLLAFPAVKIIDVLFARAVVEILSAGLVILILFAIFWAFGVDFVPRDVVQAGLALMAMMFLGLAMGVVNGVVAAAVPLWATGYALLMILMWIASGVLFVPDALPEFARNVLSYLPFLQGIEWMRSSYYEGYGSSILDRTYLIGFSAIFLFIGLVLERVARGKLLV